MLKKFKIQLVNALTVLVVGVLLHLFVVSVFVLEIKLLFLVVLRLCKKIGCIGTMLFIWFSHCALTLCFSFGIVIGH